VIRGGAGTLLGRATGVLATQHTPSGRTDNLLYAYGEVCGAVELARKVVDLAAAVTESLCVDRAACAHALEASAALATDVAEVLSLECGLDYRSAYRVVGRAVADGALNARGLERAARDVLGRPVEIDAAKLERALDLDEALAARVVTGGAAPAPMAAMLTRAPAAVEAATARLAHDRDAIASAEAALIAQAQSLAG
jgi:argininosuccinate lyase